MKITRADRIKASQIHWLVKDRIPFGMISLVAGRPKQGKSLWTAWLAAEATKQGHRVIFSNQEDAVAQTLVPRLEAAGVDMKRCFLPHDPYVLPADIDKLERKVKQMRAGLIVLDAAVQHLSVSIYNDQQVRRALTPLRAMLERNQCACVLVTHTTKYVSASSHPLEAIGGAGGGLVGAARAIFAFGPNPKSPEERILSPIGGNVMSGLTGTEYALEVVKKELNPEKGGSLTIETARLNLVDHESKVKPLQILRFTGGRGGGQDDDPMNVTRLAMAEEWLTGLLMNGPLAVADIEEEANEVKVSWRTVRRAADSIDVKKTRHGFGKGGHWRWELPDGHPLKDATEDLDEELAELLKQGQIDVDDDDEGDGEDE